ncbi:50S ribosomal protein L28 [Pelagibacterales bacterium]|jgi:large subunit ribosomal protein L28|nr:50S ribosomal protein L28 [Pelagibacterales bacterium]
MTRACDLTGKKVQFGHNVSKANNKTKRKFIPNIQSVTFRSEILNKNVRLSVAASSIRTVAKYGSIDDYLLKVKSNKLSPKAKVVKKSLLKKTATV